MVTGANGTPTREVLRRQMSAPTFPVDLNDAPAALEFTEGRDRQRFQVGEAEVTVARANHPDQVYAYQVASGGSAVVYATDTEHYRRVDPRLVALARGADVLIYDAQYLPGEYAGEGGMSRVGWGHSTCGGRGRARARRGRRQAGALPPRPVAYGRGRGGHRVIGPGGTGLRRRGGGARGDVHRARRREGSARGVQVRGVFKHIVGSSPAVGAVYEQITRAAAVDATVLRRATSRPRCARAATTAARPRGPSGWAATPCAARPRRRDEPPRGDAAQPCASRATVGCAAASTQSSTKDRRRHISSAPSLPDEGRAVGEPHQREGRGHARERPR